MNFPRRRFLQFAGAAAIAPAFLRVALRAAPPVSIAPQPYFANVKRAIGALTTLGAPIGAADAARIAALTQSGDVDAAEQILDRYTLARLPARPDHNGS